MLSHYYSHLRESMGGAGGKNPPSGRHNRRVFDPWEDLLRRKWQPIQCSYHTGESYGYWKKLDGLVPAGSQSQTQLNRLSMHVTN